MKVTIRDIAREAEVSVTAVSLVLNGRPNNVSESTIDRIRAIAEKHHYSPNQTAVSLVTKKTKTIGLVIPDISNNFFAELAKAVEHHCNEAGYSVVLCNTNNDSAKDRTSVDLLVRRGVDGLIITFSPWEDSPEKAVFVEEMNHLAVPFISLDSWIDGLTGSGVSIHHSKGGYLATKHLIGLGHSRIGCITGSKHNYSAVRRLKGYTSALLDSGLPFDPEFVEEGDYGYRSGYEAALRLISKGVTALFVSNDLMAYGAYLAAKESGKRIPADLSIVGFDDLFFSSMLSVPLTTVRQSVDVLGKTACELLFGQMRHEEPEIQYLQLEPRLVVRDSTRSLSGSEMNRP